MPEKLSTTPQPWLDRFAEDASGHSVSSEGSGPESRSPAKVVAAVATGCAALPDPWAVARAEIEALKAQVEHERNPKPPRPLCDDEAWPDMPPKHAAQHNDKGLATQPAPQTPEKHK